MIQTLQVINLQMLVVVLKVREPKQKARRNATKHSSDHVCRRKPIKWLSISKYISMVFVLDGRYASPKRQKYGVEKDRRRRRRARRSTCRTIDETLKRFHFPQVSVGGRGILLFSHFRILDVLSSKTFKFLGFSLMH